MNMAKFVLSGFLMYLYMRKRAASVYRICFPWNYWNEMQTGGGLEKWEDCVWQQSDE